MFYYENELPAKVLITGGTGSLGTALIQRLINTGNIQITAVARNETKMNQLRQRFPTIRGEIGDVRDLSWLRTIFPGHQLVIHAAAIKIVPLAEANPREAYLTNVQGSNNVAQAAVESGVKRVIGISTDKVCGPTYYGVTKRLMEGLFRQARDWGDTDFVLCRYGNVLKSANSIVPLFERQIQEDIPFTVTHLEMTRFWLSMRQAVELVFSTINFARSGEIFVPKAPAMKIVDVARTLDPNREIKEIGIRSGERLHESLLVREEAMHTTQTDRHFVICPPEVEVPLQDRLPFQYEYTSDKPNHWLTSEELIKMLEDS